LYQVTLTAKNSKGCSDVATSFVIVADTPPLPDFEIDKGLACAGEEVKFKQKSTGADFYCWNFGNHQTSSGDSVTYRYPKPGTYSVTLTAKNAGCTAQKTIHDAITIKSPFITFSAIKHCT